VIATFGIEDVERFRVVVARRLGLQFEDARSGFLGEVLRRRLEATRQACTSYLHDVEGEDALAELGALAKELTVSETYFFRNIDQFHAFSQHVVPERIRERGPGGRLRLLSAGCASGEEAYSLAITLQETLGASRKSSILAVDVNPGILEKARRARFSSWSLRETPPDVQHRWFAPAGRDVVLDESIRTAVKFERHNLAEDDPELWQPEAYDVVFCRNVIMYFTPHGARAIVERITRSLAPGGYLFLGHAETLRGLSSDFRLCHTHGTFYYQRKRDQELTSQREQSPQWLSETPGRGGPEPSAVPASLEEPDTWVDAIRLGAERVQRLTESPQLRAVARTALGPGPARQGWNLGPPLELLRQERFADALGLVEALPPEATSDPDVLLLQAALLTQSGLLESAQETCRRLLDIDELNAGARYLLALCYEGSGKRRDAVDQDRAAIYLDPEFAMPHVHLGLLARRVRDVRTARREFGQASTLLQREDASRILLFGGGFSRGALITLCRAELLSSGASS
jgi:chemotaxis protein methyltransferase CheR